MKSLPLTDCSRRLGAPDGWNHETQGICSTLEIFDTPDGYMRSAWRPSDVELQRLNAGKPLFLEVMGQVHPPVSLFVADAEPLPTTLMEIPNELVPAVEQFLIGMGRRAR